MRRNAPGLWPPGGPGLPSSAVEPSRRSTIARGDRRDRGDRVGPRCRRRRAIGLGAVAGDAGAVTVVAAVAVVALLAMTVLVVQFGAAVLARQRAEIGADLAALAAASWVLRGADAACAHAVSVATANNAILEDCRIRGADALVTVLAEVTAGPITGLAIGRARAGPADEIVG